MKSLSIKVLALLLLVQITFSQGPDFSYYHTTADLYKKISYFEENCNNMFKTKIINKEPLIHLIDIKKNSDSEKHKAYFLFGEHAREMISPEAGLSLIEKICQNDKNENTLITSLLEKFHIQMVLNANPLSRKKVEQGDYCLRVNENGVDLNRNWDAHWQKSGDLISQTNSGDLPFSETETQAIKDSLERFNPKVFLTVHSGAMGMYIPYAYSTEKGTYNENHMMNVLTQLNPKHCQCNPGAAGREVGYLCPGTCLDYAYDKMKVPYVFAWEIYDRGFNFDKLELEQTPKFLQVNNKKSNVHEVHKKSLFSCFVQTSVSTMNGLSTDQCFDFFNPMGETKYKLVVKNWVNAMLEMLDKVDEQESTKQL